MWKYITEANILLSRLALVASIFWQTMKKIRLVVNLHRSQQISTDLDVTRVYDGFNQREFKSDVFAFRKVVSQWVSNDPDDSEKTFSFSLAFFLFLFYLSLTFSLSHFHSFSSSLTLFLLYLSYTFSLTPSLSVFFLSLSLFLSFFLTHSLSISLSPLHLLTHFFSFCLSFYCSLTFSLTLSYLLSPLSLFLLLSRSLSLSNPKKFWAMKCYLSLNLSLNVKSFLYPICFLFFYFDFVSLSQ